MKYIKFLLISFLFVGCAKKVAFTSDIQNEYKFPEDKLKKVQFYTSDEIVLFKTKDSGDAMVSDGKLFMRNEKNSEKIVIKKNTPCVLEKIIEQNKFLFSFEYGEGRVLLFGNNSSGYYSLMAKNWSNKTATIKYANNSYVTNSGSVFLTIKVRKLNKLKSIQRTVKGRKV